MVSGEDFPLNQSIDLYYDQKMFGQNQSNPYRDWQLTQIFRSTVSIKKPLYLCCVDAVAVVVAGD